MSRQFLVPSFFAMALISHCTLNLVLLSLLQDRVPSVLGLVLREFRRSSSACEVQALATMGKEPPNICDVSMGLKSAHVPLESRVSILTEGFNTVIHL
jgi:hypothetical protein